MLEFIYNHLPDLCMVAFIIEAAAIIWAGIRYFHYKRTRIFTPIVILIAGTMVSAVILFLNIGYEFLVAVHSAIRLFVVDFDLGDFLSSANDEELFISYRLVSYLSVFAPLLTFTVVLSLIHDVLSHIELLFYGFHDKYIFSELNEKSIVLAESIFKENRNSSKRRWIKIIFMGTEGEGDDSYIELTERAKTIQAICFKKEMSAINFRFRAGRLSFFAINEEREENVKAAARIREVYGKRANTKLYLFSASVEAEMFVSAGKEEKLEIRCMNEACSVVYRTLYNMEADKIKNNTPDLFSQAVSEGTYKKISAVIVGMGQYGTEMLKALLWFCQMEGYRVKIDAFDIGTEAEQHFRAACPEIMDEKHNRVYKEGDAYYDVTIHPDTDAESDTFRQTIQNMAHTTYVFVALGSDEANIAAAARLRTLYEQKRMHPMIHAIVYNSDKVHVLSGCRNFKGQAYDIQYIGDLDTVYSQDVILKSDLEEEALKVQAKYGYADNLEKIKKDFYAYEYNYRSSMASAIHLKARVACGLQGEGIKEDIKVLSILEHRRWNAYMRTEGYIYSGSLNKASRNDLGKMHNLLVPYDELPEEEKEKDRRISLEDIK